MPDKFFYGYIYKADRYGQPVKLEGKRAVADFIKANLYAEELKVCDAADRLVFHALDGVDVFNGLDAIGIDLADLYRSVRRDAVSAEVGTPKKEEWERLYDQVGLSPGEISMRQRVKKAAKAARTAADVAELIRGTYFNARFYSRNDTDCWGYLDEKDLTVSKLSDDETDPHADNPESERRTALSPDARVQHRSSAEDVHIFTLLDPPDETRS